ncbi:MAG: UPF0236 family protein [Oscillospiraceae bacterium]|nr:UPF0236 family protein [Oscillospiraceae bacterium]
MTITVEVEESKRRFQTFDDIVSFASELGMEIGREFVNRILEARDEELRKERDTRRYRCKGKQQTSIKTKLGAIEYRRNVYIDRSVADGIKCVHLLDEDLGIEKIGQIAKEVCETAGELVCESSYRAATRTITETTGLSISPQGVWNIVQKLGEQRAGQVERHTELTRLGRGVGCVESKILYEENDGVWLKLQGKDRKECGPSKEMKVGIAYDGATWEKQKSGKPRRTLDCKVAHASFEPAKKFRESKEGVIASRYDVKKIELRIINGDGANWIQKKGKAGCICVLDKFHRNKKLTECIKDKDFLETARNLLFSNRIDDLLTCIAAQIDSTEDEAEQDGLRELLTYYAENREAMTGPYDRGIDIPETRAPGIIHHARLGSMESNIFTLIGNRMKDRRCCWSIRGANHLANLLCLKHTTGLDSLFPSLEPMPQSEPVWTDVRKPISASRMPLTAGSGTECYNRTSIPNLPWLKDIFSYCSFTELTF